MLSTRMRAMHCIHLVISLFLVLLSAEMNYSFQRNTMTWSTQSIIGNNRSNLSKSWSNLFRTSKKQFHQQAQDLKNKLTRKVSSGTYVSDHYKLLIISCCCIQGQRIVWSPEIAFGWSADAATGELFKAHHCYERLTRSECCRIRPGECLHAHSEPASDEDQPPDRWRRGVPPLHAALPARIHFAHSHELALPGKPRPEG